MASKTADNLDHLYPPLSPPLAKFFWVFAAFIFWLWLGICFDAIVVFRNSTPPPMRDLETVSVKILHVSQRTPNFKVQCGDGTTGYLSFPDRLGLDPKGGLTMRQITDDHVKWLQGCDATVKVKTVPSAFGRRKEVWDLSCPRTHLHFGPAVAGSQVSAHPRFDLVSDLVFSLLLLFGALCAAVIARTLGRKGSPGANATPPAIGA